MIFLVIASCTNDKEVIENNQSNSAYRQSSNFDKKFIIKDATDKLSKLSHAIGVLKVLNVKNNNDVYNFELLRQKKNVNGNDFSLHKNFTVSQSKKKII